MPGALGLSLLLLALLAAVPAAAQQPFVTDDSEVTAFRKLHMEFSNHYQVLQRSQYPNLRQNTASVEFAYGVWKNVEVGIEMPWIAIFNAPGARPRSLAGIGDAMLTAKWNFRREPEGVRGLGMSAQVQLELPTGSTARQLGSGVADIGFNGVIQTSLTERTKLRLNGGVLFSGNTLTGVVGVAAKGLVSTASASLMRSITPRLQLGAEVAGALTRDLDLGKGALQVQAGGNYVLRPGFSFDFGLLGGRYSGSPRLGLQLGFSVDF